MFSRHYSVPQNCSRRPLNRQIITCSELTVETLEKGVKYVQKLTMKTPEHVNDV